VDPQGDSALHAGLSRTEHEIKEESVDELLAQEKDPNLVEEKRQETAPDLAYRGGPRNLTGAHRGLRE